MRDYKRIPTSAEVFAVIRARHPNLRLHGSFSDPEGRFMGGAGEQGRMETSYGFPDCDQPIIEIRTTWDIAPDGDPAQLNRKNEYWLCVAKDSGEADNLEAVEALLKAGK